jgi:hypothetical protein
VGTRGLNFTVPGPYRVWAEFDVDHGRSRCTVQSNEVEFELASPRAETDAIVSRRLSDPRIAFFVAHKGGALALSRRRELRELVAAWPRHEALQHVRYALGADYKKRGQRALARGMLHKIRLREDSLKEGLERLHESL